MTIERTYTVPLRSGYRNAPAYYRTNKAMATLRAFLVRHMKVADDKIKIGQYLNEEIWRHGIKNPPARITITVKKTDDGIVTAELEGKTFKESVRPMAREEQPQGLKEKIQSAVGKKEEKSEEAEVTDEAAPKPKKAKKPKAEAAE